MRYLSIDIETTGLDPVNDQILSIGAIIEDTENPLPFDEIPKFHAAIKRERIEGGLYAINMNRELLGTINDYMNARSLEEKDDIVHMTGMQFLDEDMIVEDFYYWLAEHRIVETNEVGKGGLTQISDGGTVVLPIKGTTKPTHITVAGKNFATFDKLFIERLPRWKQLFRIRQRIIDPAVLYVDWKEDDSLPGLPLCKERAGLDSTVTHNAVEDAWDVIEILRKKY